METAQVKRFFNGPEAFTPDGEFCLGESDVPGFWVAAGFCAHGLAGAGGVGKVMAEWIVDGQPEYDVWHMDIKRFGRHYRSQRYTLARTYEAPVQVLRHQVPGRGAQGARPLRVSPAYPRLAALGAAFGEKAGWERVNWFATNEAGRRRGAAPARLGRAELVAGHRRRGARHPRRAPGIFDQSSFSKLEVLGPGATAFLERLAPTRSTGPVGSIVYTQLLNPRGGIECDLSVIAPRAPTATSSSPARRSATTTARWIERHLPADGTRARARRDVRAACFCVWGPRARDILQPLTRTSLANADFPYLTRPRARPSATCRCSPRA